MHEDDIHRFHLLDAEIKGLEVVESDIDSDAMFEIRLERNILKQF